MTLKEKYDSACNEYAKKFAKKHGLRFGYWVGDRTGYMACFNGDCFMSMVDIRLDIDDNIPVYEFEQWYYSDDKNYYVHLHKRGLLKR